MSKLQMKSCTLWGDMSSDRASEQYPEEAVCVDCIASEQAQGENSRIVAVGGDVTDPNATCALCDCGPED